MNQKSISIVLILVGLFLGISFTNLKIIAQSSPPSSPPASSPKPQKQRSIWQTILSILKAKEPRGVSRSIGSLCLISPGLLETKNQIWSNRPLFLWIGTTLPLEIRLYSPFNLQQDQVVLWSQKIAAPANPETVQSLFYPEKVLESGQSYDWEIVVNGRSYRYTFEVMPSPERDRLTADVQILEIQQQKEGKTEEVIALEKVNYLIQRDLWSDALQVIFAVKNPSLDLQKQAQTIITHFCQPKQ